MSYPNIPDISPDIDLSREDIVNLLLASIALEEIGLAHLINAEAEKIQYVLGTLEGQTPSQSPSIEDLLQINDSVEQTLRSVIKKQMLLEFKLEDTIGILSKTSTTTTTSTSTSTTTTTKSTTTTSSSSSSTTTTTKSTTTTSSSSSSTTTTKCPPFYPYKKDMQNETIND